MDWLDAHWTWLASNPKGAIAQSLALVAGTWAIAAGFYKNRIEHLKERIEGEKAKASSPGPAPTPARFEYPPAGRHGRNVLSNAVHEVRVGEALSLRAHIPPGSRLHVVLRGLAQIYVEETHGSWMFPLGSMTQWAATPYRPVPEPEQHFDAEAGIADLEITFTRTGDLMLQAFEGTDQEASWSRTIRVMAD